MGRFSTLFCFGIYLRYCRIHLRYPANLPFNFSLITAIFWREVSSQVFTCEVPTSCMTQSVNCIGFLVNFSYINFSSPELYSLCSHFQRSLSHTLFFLFSSFSRWPLYQGSPPLPLVRRRIPRHPIPIVPIPLHRPSPIVPVQRVVPNRKPTNRAVIPNDLVKRTHARNLNVTPHLTPKLCFDNTSLTTRPLSRFPIVRTNSVF